MHVTLYCTECYTVPQKNAREKVSRFRDIITNTHKLPKIIS